MKIINPILSLTMALAFVGTAFAASPLAGPKGGRILTSEAPHIEFLVAGDRSVVVSFYDADLRPLAAAGQVVTATAEAKAGKVTLSFTAKDGAFVSSAPLPDSAGYRVVVQIRDSAQARPKNYRLEYHAEVCGECKRAEYACICEAHGKEPGEHKH